MGEGYGAVDGAKKVKLPPAGVCRWAMILSAVVRLVLIRAYRGICSVKARMQCQPPAYGRGREPELWALTSDAPSDLKLLVASCSLLDLESHELSGQPRLVLSERLLDRTGRALDPDRYERTGKSGTGELQISSSSQPSARCWVARPRCPTHPGFAEKRRSCTRTRARFFDLE